MTHTRTKALGALVSITLTALVLASCRTDGEPTELARCGDERALARRLGPSARNVVLLGCARTTEGKLFRAVHFVLDPSALSGARSPFPGAAEPAPCLATDSTDDPGLSAGCIDGSYGSADIGQGIVSSGGERGVVTGVTSGRVRAVRATFRRGRLVEVPVGLAKVDEPGKLRRIGEPRPLGVFAASLATREAARLTAFDASGRRLGSTCFELGGRSCRGLPR